LIKQKKKWFYLNFIESLNLFRHVTLLYTDKSEINEKYFTHSHSHIISDPFPSQLQQVEKKKLLKSKGMLKLIFLSRIHPIKNLHYVIERLFSFKEKLIELTVVGHIDDEPYWIKCKDMIKLLPNSIVVNYLGVINPTNVYDVLQSNHVFILPTLGENFGYAIFETFLAGRPVIISDQTPWQKLQERQVGWSIPIIDTEAWERAIANCIELNQTDFDEYCQNSWHFSRKYIEKSSLKKDYIHIFTND
jgi:glycosyltransferase involved in cell wall biosynthesis